MALHARFNVSFKREEYGLVLAFLLSYLVYRFGLNLGFRSSTMQYYMQFPDMVLLKTDLLQSLFYLHAQPPMMSLLLGLAVKTGYPELLFQCLYFLLACVTLLCIARVLAMAGVSGSIRFCIMAWLVVNPTFMLYCNWLSATQPELTCVAVIFYALMRIFTTRSLSMKYCLMIFVPCAVLALLRPQWHLMAFIGLAGVLWYCCREYAGKKYILHAAALSFLPVLSLYTKNLLIFGFFGASSWAGMNLAEMSSQALPGSELQQLKDSNSIYEGYPIKFSEDKADTLRAELKDKGAELVELEHPIVAQKYKTNQYVNYNYQPFIEASQSDMRDSMVIIQHDPLAYLSAVWKQAVHISFRPAMWSSIEYRSIVEANFYWLQPLTFLFYVVTPVLVLTMLPFSQGITAPSKAILACGGWLALWILASSNLLSGGTEGERMRWTVLPFYVLCAALLWQQVKDYLTSAQKN